MTIYSTTKGRSEGNHEMTEEGILMSSADENGDVIVYGNDGKIVRARTKNQKKLVCDYYKHDLTFAIGPAGTGKTYTAIALAVRALKNREVKKLILTRPAVEAGERLGFLPGDLKDKLDPYLQPLYRKSRRGRRSIPAPSTVHWYGNGSLSAFRRQRQAGSRP